RNQPARVNRSRSFPRKRESRAHVRKNWVPALAGTSGRLRRRMNYRHAFHAGNFADVVKHAVLCRIVAHLKEKPAAFRVIDTHAGAGLYDLAGPEASRTGEWRDGIGKLVAADLAPAVRDLLAPYLEAVA